MLYCTCTCSLTRHVSLAYLARARPSRIQERHRPPPQSGLFLFASPLSAPQSSRSPTSRCHPHRLSSSLPRARIAAPPARCVLRGQLLARGHGNATIHRSKHARAHAFLQASNGTCSHCLLVHCCRTCAIRGEGVGAPEFSNAAALPLSLHLQGKSTPLHIPRGARDQCGRTPLYCRLPLIIMRRKFLAIHMHAPSEQGRTPSKLMTAAGGHGMSASPFGIRSHSDCSDCG